MTFTKDVVPTKENFVWQFNVESNLKEEITTLGWDNSYFGNGKEIYLMDVATHKITNMVQETHYDFSRASSKEFKVIYGNPEFAKQELTPENAILFDPYPSPFLNQVTIEYSLPREANEVGGEIAIFNSLGSKISAVNMQRQFGAGKWIWESEGQTSGLY